MKLYTAEQMRDLDRQAIDILGIPGVALMENAGRGAADLLRERFEPLRPGPVLVLAGKGNNGGDGYVMARHLANHAWNVVTVVLADREAVSGDAAINLEVLVRSGGQIHFCPDATSLSDTLATQKPRLLVDALFGTGLSSQVAGHYAQAIDWVNESGLPVFSVDIPSGVDATTGKMLGRAVKAQVTATFAGAKLGQVLYPACDHVGELLVLDIGIPEAVVPKDTGAVLAEAAEVVSLFPARPSTGHKGTFGHLLIVAGSSGKSGAAAMAAEGGLRAGSGLVTVGCPTSVHSVLETKLTEAMTAALPEMDGALSLQAMEDLERLLEQKQALAIGPGLGLGEEVSALVRRVVRSCSVSVVVDADGLNALAGNLEVLLDRPRGTAVLTPHPGEMARLLGTSVKAIEEDRIGVARDFALRYGVVLLLKGARTLVATPEGRLFVNSSGNPGLASGGMGDVLTGLIGGLLAQGLNPADAAVLGAYWHGRAADDLCAGQGNAGMIATDVLRQLPLSRHNLILSRRNHAIR